MLLAPECTNTKDGCGSVQQGEDKSVNMNEKSILSEQLALTLLRHSVGFVHLKTV